MLPTHGKGAPPLATLKLAARRVVDAQLARIEFDTETAMTTLACELSDAAFAEEFKTWLRRCLDAILQEYVPLFRDEHALQTALKSEILHHVIWLTLEQSWCTAAIGEEIELGCVLLSSAYDMWLSKTNTDDGYQRGAYFHNIVNRRWLFWRAKLLSELSSQTAAEKKQVGSKRDSAEAREARFQDFRDCTGAEVSAVRKAANVHDPDMQRWRHGKMPAHSVMAKRIEAVLSGKTPLKSKGQPQRRVSALHDGEED